MRLAGSRARDVLALVALLATAYRDTRPLPVGAGTLGAENVDGNGLGGNRTLDVRDSKTSDRDAVSRLASRRAVFVVLLDDDALLGDVLESDALVLDVLDTAGLAGNSLDADAVVGVDDLGVGDGHAVDDVVVAAADGADGQAMAAGAVAAGEGDVFAAVDGEAVVLVVDSGAGDGDVLGITDVLIKIPVNYKFLVSEFLYYLRDDKKGYRKEGRLANASVL